MKIGMMIIMMIIITIIMLYHTHDHLNHLNHHDYRHDDHHKIKSSKGRFRLRLARARLRRLRFSSLRGAAVAVVLTWGEDAACGGDNPRKSTVSETG